MSPEAVAEVGGRRSSSGVSVLMLPHPGLSSEAVLVVESQPPRQKTLNIKSIQVYYVPNENSITPPSEEAA